MSRRLIVAGVVVALAGFAAIVLGRAVYLPSRQLEVEPVTPAAIDADAAARHLAGALRFETVSREDAAAPTEALEALRAYILASFPRVHAALEQEIVSEHSLLYRWQGSDSALPPMLLAAHMDVVPAEDTDGAPWTHPPFDGVIADGYVWGRGAIDDKFCVIGILEAVEQLLADGFQPKRTVYLAFGHDEEIGGAHGAADIAALLAARHVTLEFVLDEGLPVTVGIVPGVAAPVALVGIAEKGYVTVALRTTAAGGHSSTPPPQSAVGILAAAVHALEEHPFPARFSGVASEMFAYLAPEMALAQRVVFANRWAFTPVVEHVLAQHPETDALMRTTTAVTVIEGGVKDNVLPQSARALVNFRTLPGDGPDEVVAHVRSVIDDPRIEVQIVSDAWGAVEPAPVASASFERMQRSVREVFPDAIVAPGLVLGATDARRYSPLSSNIFRFTPVPTRSEDIARIHGMNERVAVTDFARGVQFYYRLIHDGA